MNECLTTSSQKQNGGHNKDKVGILVIMMALKMVGTGTEKIQDSETVKHLSHFVSCFVWSRTAGPKGLRKSCFRQNKEGQGVTSPMQFTGRN